MKAQRMIVAIALSAVSCGGGETRVGEPDTGASDAPDTAVPDVGVDPDAPTDPDAAEVPECGTWRLVELGAETLYLMDPLAINTERSFRVSATTLMTGCQRWAMPLVEIDGSALEARITVRAWESSGLECTADLRTVVRFVLLRLPSAGTWTVRDAGGIASLSVEVLPPPPRPCGATVPCEMDCDCPRDGTVCLSGYGVGGPFSSCAMPCESDMDCTLGGTCTSYDDGLEQTCDEYRPQCDSTEPCRPGYECVEEMCRPTFGLGASARVECRCDSGCAPPLACAMPSEGATAGRCELLCPTGASTWCSAMHVCGPASMDVSGLAATDSVCVWLGE